MHRIVFPVLLALSCGCSPKAPADKALFWSCVGVTEQTIQRTGALFFRPKSADLQTYAASLNALLKRNKQSDNCLSKPGLVAHERFVPTIPVDIPQGNLRFETEAAKKAYLQRQAALCQMLTTHLFVFFTPALLSEQTMPGTEALLTSLQALQQDYPVINAVPLEVYHADNASGLLAYRYQSASAQAFVVFNFSYDNHPLPLPFGFMASTKVALWRSDALKIVTFVTREPLIINPLQAVVVIVG